MNFLSFFYSGRFFFKDSELLVAPRCVNIPIPSCGFHGIVLILLCFVDAEGFFFET